MKKLNAIIMGASGKDFHVFLTYFKNNSLFNIVAFTQAQIPGIEKRNFPKKLAGKLYKKNIPFYPESQLSKLIKKFKVDYVFLAYSDLSHKEVMEKASFVLSCGANFSILGTKDTMIESKTPVISITAVRTGCGKSQTSRAIGLILKNHNKKISAIRHAMPYGNLIKQEVQKFSNYKDFKKHKCTIEEIEEYEPWIKLGFSIYAGVDYKKILEKAEKGSDFLIFDGGNNDWSFYKPDLNIVVTDAFRPNHEISYFPGFVNLLTADVIIINKVNTAKKSDIKIIENNIRKYNSKAKVIKAQSIVKADRPELLRNKNVLVIEDGPTLTHGGLPHGAGYVILNKYKGRMIDARKYAVGSIKNIYKKYTHLKKELPAMGYSKKQLKELEKTINKAKCDVVLDSSPADLSKILKVNKPIVNVTYELGFKSIKELHKILKKLKYI